MQKGVLLYLFSFSYVIFKISLSFVKRCFSRTWAGVSVRCCSGRCCSTTAGATAGAPLSGVGAPILYSPQIQINSVDFCLRLVELRLGLDL